MVHSDFSSERDPMNLIIPRDPVRWKYTSMLIQLAVGLGMRGILYRRRPRAELVRSDWTNDEEILHETSEPNESLWLGQRGNRVWKAGSNADSFAALENLDS